MNVVLKIPNKNSFICAADNIEISVSFLFHHHFRYKWSKQVALSFSCVYLQFLSLYTAFVLDSQYLLSSYIVCLVPGSFFPPA